MGDQLPGRAIVRSVIALAQALDLSVVAEGVESTQQLDALRALDCHEGEGYRFAKPQPAHQISRLLETQGVANHQPDAETALAV